MSRVGKDPITLPDGVQVDIGGDALVVKGPKGELTTPIPEGISMKIDDGVLVAERSDEAKQTRAYHGLARALAANAVEGVSRGFEKRLEIQGIGYRAKMEGRSLVLQVGYSHPVEFEVPEGIEIAVPDPTKIVVSGIDKQCVGEIAARIRRVRPPDAYKGKGIRYEGEFVRLKVGKAGAATV
jgi:large subunit ribosomal protein L6